MKIKIILAFCLLSLSANSQVTIDTLKGIVPRQSTFLHGNISGVTRDGHYYNVNYVCHYLNGDTRRPQNMEITRTDFTTHATIKKEIPALSSTSALWVWVMDSLGNVYQSFNTNLRQIIVFNFKDSIWFKALGGNPNGALAYSMKLGTDNHIICGGSSANYNNSTTWWEINPYDTFLITVHPPVNPNQDYDLTIQGDTDWIYAQVGQRNQIEYWAVRKSDDYKKLMWTLPATTRFNIKTGRNGINYVYFGTTTYSLKDTTATLIPTYNGYIPRDVCEANCSNLGSPTTKITSMYNEGTNQLIFNVNNGSFDTSTIICDSVKSAIRLIFQFPGDMTHIYFAGDYYGKYYDSNLVTHTVTRMGATGYNVYSYFPLNDSEYLLGSYPNGHISKWNRNQPWTSNTFVNGHLQSESSSTNPKYIGDVRTRTPAQIHYPLAIRLDSSKNVIILGRVVRVQNGMSIATYYPANDSFAGIDCNRFTGLDFAGVSKEYNRVFWFSTNNAYGGHPKLFSYSSYDNAITDSIDFGYNDYGRLFIREDTLIGVTTQFFYKIYLPTKQLISKTNLSSGGAIGLDYKILMLWTAAVMPDTGFIRFNYGNGFYTGFNHSIFTIDGNNNVLWIKNIYTQPLNLQSLQKASFYAYPNPASRIINVPNGDYSMYNALGVKVLNKKETQIIYIASLINGAYYLRDDRTGSTKKIIILK